MIYGVGTDIVRVARMQENLERFGERFARRILAAGEWDGFQRAVHPPRFLAKRFAAKEATVKAFGTGFRDGLALAQIAVGHDALGRPVLEFTGRAAEFVREVGIGECHLSIADEDAYAVAFVTLERA